MGTGGNPDTKCFSAFFLQVRLWIIATRRRKSCAVSKKFTFAPDVVYKYRYSPPHPRPLSPEGARGELKRIRWFSLMKPVLKRALPSLPRGRGAGGEGENSDILWIIRLT